MQVPQRARFIIMKNPDHIVVLDCPCRSAREHPCLPLVICDVMMDAIFPNEVEISHDLIHDKTHLH